MLVNTEHFEQAYNFRVDDVMHHLMTRPERLYPRKKFEPDPGVSYFDALQSTPKEKRTFKTVEEALAAVKRWCDD